MLNVDLDTALAVAHSSYADRRPRSAALAVAAATVMPGGNTRTVLHFDPFPFRVDHAEGSVLVDVDGHRYVDMLANYTAGLFGHQVPAVRDAVIAQLDRGWSIGATHALEVELAELICGRFESIEQVRFTNSGTEANLMAIGTAMHVTGRRKVLVFEEGYHGGVLTFAHGAGPLNVPHDFLVVPYNDVPALQAAFAAAGSEIACAVVEPVQGSGGCIPAEPDFLQALRALCTQYGSVLVFDEVMTSRLHPGGAQARFGVVPDMTTLGKYLGGGMTFGAFGGSRSIMAAFDPAQGGALSQAGTFNNNVVTMAAGVAALRDVLTPDVLIALNERGDVLRERLSVTLAGAGIPMTVVGVGSMMNLHADDGRWVELFFHAMLAAGFYVARRGMIALALDVTDEQLAAFGDAVERWAADPFVA
ncbi:MAG TPA: aspartate aminotransferase family protein [Ilumatobacteraceae bacterium]|nr:aspartate aminotransferase family protein [Ilumatobacteraceae bacterium]HRB02756.1 aspartate aminotransferase family protein [Ilumatobacteraceae bacterium]